MQITFPGRDLNGKRTAGLSVSVGLPEKLGKNSDGKWGKGAETRHLKSSASLLGCFVVIGFCMIPANKSWGKLRARSDSFADPSDSQTLEVSSKHNHLPTCSVWLNETFPTKTKEGKLLSLFSVSNISIKVSLCLKFLRGSKQCDFVGPGLGSIST